MRIQVMPLTAQIVGQFTETPFVIVLDGEDAEEFAAACGEGLKRELGAKLVIASEGTIDVGAPLVLTDDQQASIIDRIQGIAYSLKPEHYSPRCVPCHKRFDLDRINAAVTYGE